MSSLLTPTVVTRTGSLDGVLALIGRPDTVVLDAPRMSNVSDELPDARVPS